MRAVRPSAVGRVVLAGTAALVIAAVSAGAQNVRLLRTGPDAQTDSLVDRIYKARVDEVHRIVAAWRERDGQLIASIRALPPDADLIARRRLDEDFMRSSREAFAMMRAIQERCVIERGPVPDGYIGVSLDTRIPVVDGRRAPAEVLVSSVEPGGPSQRAGLMTNDRLLAIGGRDARQGIPDIGDLLVPGRTVTLRVDREGATRELVVTVEPRPKDFAASCGEFERVLMPLRIGAFRGILERRSAPADAASGGVATGVITSGEVASGGGRVVIDGGLARRRSESPDEIQVFVFNSGGPNEVYFAGAKFRALDDDWRELLGVKQGVMVYDVATGSVAARAGLKGGDVVTAVGEAQANDPMMFVHLLGVEERREATLSVMRDKKPRRVTLRWGPEPPPRR